MVKKSVVQQLVKVNGVDLCMETFGDADDPAVLLIGGAANSMDWWEDEFCQQLAAERRFVVRYDNRDTGRSTSYPAGAPGYTGPDLVADAVGLLDTLNLTMAHIVGISTGGGIAQHLAVEHPGRVASLTLISTSPDGPGDPDPRRPAGTAREGWPPDATAAGMGRGDPRDLTAYLRPRAMMAGSIDPADRSLQGLGG